MTLVANSKIMATQVGAQILTKGPLSTALGQYIFLGLGTFALFTGDNGVSKACQDVATICFRLVTGRDSLPSSAALLREAALGHSNQTLHNGGGHQQQPIVIHSHAAPSSNSKYGSWTTLIIQVGFGSFACWTAYFLFSNFLPDQLKEMMPVTRKFFESAVTSLGNGIIRVRDALSEQIAIISGKQDELCEKQNETHDQVLGIKDDIGNVRLHIDDIAVAISRCEGSLTDAAGRQTYMSRGVRLLVQCVGDLMRPSNPKVAEELDQFSRLSSELMESEEDFYYGENNNNNRGKNYNKGGRQQLEYPSSPNLSEIGSMTSTSVDEHNHHRQQQQHVQQNMRPLSLPRPRKSQSIVTPREYNTPSSSTADAVLPNSTSKIMGGSRGIFGSMNSPAPPTSRALKMLQSFNRGGSSGETVTTAASSSMSYSRSYSSPEDEVPQSNYYDMSGTATPTSDSTDPVKLDEITDLMRVIRSGSMPVGV